MAEDKAQEKTEEATPKREQEARERGQVPRSRELATMGVLMVAAGAMLIIGDRIISGIVKVMRDGFQLSRTDVMDSSTVLLAFQQALVDAVITLLPFFAIVMVIALLAPMGLSGWSFSAEAMSFKWEKLDPVKGLGRVFSVRGLVELVKALAKFAVIITGALILLWNNLDELLSLGLKDYEVALKDAGQALAWGFLLLSSTMIAIAAVDVPFQLWDHRRQLRMTKQEVKDEHKQTDGSPEMKRRMREIQQEMARRRMMEKVPDADVVITNPTHYAVALKYDYRNDTAPVVVAKGKDLIAQHIRNVAVQHDVPLVSAPPLSRALYHSTDLQQEIPAGLFVAVAQVLAYAYQLRRRPRRQRGETEQFHDLPIPDDLLYDE